MKNKLPMKFLAALMVLCAFAIAALPQSKQPKPKPDFSGRWLLDIKKSTDSGLTTRPDLPIEISHQDPELRVRRTSESKGQTKITDFVYFTDERGETNPTTAWLTASPETVNIGEVTKDATKSKTSWSGNKIVTRSLQKTIIGGNVLEFALVDEWKLSKDGNTLTQTSTVIFQQSSMATFVPAPNIDRKRVYHRL